MNFPNIGNVPEMVELRKKITIVDNKNNDDFSVLDV